MRPYQAILLMTQFKNNIKDDEQFGKLKNKHFLDLQQKVDNRLTPDLTRMYSSEYGIDGSDSRGMHILEKLNDAQADLLAMKDLMAWLALSPDGDGRTAEQLENAVRIASGRGVLLAGCVHETIVSTAMQEWQGGLVLWVWGVGNKTNICF